MSASYDQTLDSFAAELAREYMRVFREGSALTAPDLAALSEAITAQNKPAIRRILGGADMRLERAILDATTRLADKYLPAVASEPRAREALSGMVQSATKALVTGTTAGLATGIDIAASSARYEPSHLLQAIGLTDKQAALYFATVRAAQDIAASIPRNAKTANAIQAAARQAARKLPHTVASQLHPVLKDPLSRDVADTAIRQLSDKLRAHHAGPAAHVAAHSLIEETRLLQVKRDIASGKRPPTTLKRWTNPMDERTRTGHASATRANRKGVPIDQPFRTQWGPLQTPPPPGVHAYNCRCRAEFFTPTAADMTP